MMIPVRPASGFSSANWIARSVKLSAYKAPDDETKALIEDLVLRALAVVLARISWTLRQRGGQTFPRRHKISGEKTI
jgi:hypothetical protein